MTAQDFEDGAKRLFEELRNRDIFIAGHLHWDDLSDDAKDCYRGAFRTVLSFLRVASPFAPFVLYSGSSIRKFLAPPPKSGETSC